MTAPSLGIGRDLTREHIQMCFDFSRKVTPGLTVDDIMVNPGRRHNFLALVGLAFGLDKPEDGSASAKFFESRVLKLLVQLRYSPETLELMA